jgi:nitrogen regulatory protein PII
MKEIKAYVKRHRLAEVMHGLRQIEGLSGASVVEVQGFGRSAPARRHTAEDDLELLAHHARVEVVCRNELVEKVVSAIQQHARTGLRGDGRIFVSEVEQAVRIATGERGEGVV